MADFYTTRTLAIIGSILFILSAAVFFWAFRRPATTIGAGAHNLIIGFNAGRTMTHHSGCIVIGDGAEPKDSNELVVRFEDGTEFRAALPKGKHVDLRHAFGSDQKPLPIYWMIPAKAGYTAIGYQALQFDPSNSFVTQVGGDDPLAGAGHEAHFPESTGHLNTALAGDLSDAGLEKLRAAAREAARNARLGY